MKQSANVSLQQEPDAPPRNGLDWASTASDLEGHYDIDGVSYACGQVIVASDSRTIFCLSDMGNKI